MEHAKKLVLVEPRLLEQLQTNNEYKEIQKPADKKSKASLSMDMQKILREKGIGDDIKAIKFQQALSRYLAVKGKVSSPVAGNINWLTEPRQQPVQQPLFLSPPPRRVTRGKAKQASFQTVLRPKVSKKVSSEQKRTGVVSPIVSDSWEPY